MLTSAILFATTAFVILALPAYPAGLSGPWFLRIPLEVPLAGLVLLLLPRKLAKPTAAFITITLLMLLVLKLADLGVQTAFQRPFNLYLDATLVKNGWLFLSTTFGVLRTSLAIALILSACAGAGFLLWRAQTSLINTARPMRRTLTLCFAGASALTAALTVFPPATERIPLGTFHAARDISVGLVRTVQAASDLQAFETELAAPPPSSQDNLFQAIKGKDVVLVFIESYGRSALENPSFRSLTAPRLKDIETTLSGEGIYSASLWSGSPTVAGLSWLAHGTLLSGLWVDNQARYDRLMSSQWTSLNRMFSKAGWQTSAIMPAITMDWPEKNFFGYDQVLTAKDLGYRGKPFNWVTMPDQYTLTAFERLSRMPAHASGKPMMAEIALISSHAPWTPVAHLIDWQAVGDGTVFNQQATSGETPEAVWSDPVQIRDHYIRTIDYSLATLGEYISRFGQDAVFIILGDHQPAEIVTGENASREVPVHVISRDKELITRLEKTGFTAGLLPDSNTASIRMDRLRQVLIEALSGNAATPVN
ncbi:sulfatase [Labrenzia suaedae]|uniref:Sulfatase n=1 Tax=Roseibium litorale TaxID=2803841 RepID=A0ABR9CKP1_9HYPH|nr:sulfatase [Roseibium litorale]